MSTKLFWAIKDTVDAYGGGQQELAELMGVNYNSFRNKANPNKTDEKASHFTTPELFRLMQVTGDFRLLQFFADEFGFSLVRQEGEVSSPDDALLYQLQCMSRGNDGVDIKQWLGRHDIRRADFVTLAMKFMKNLMVMVERANG
ncbi:phage regulatory CII family protein [Chromobacterium haemolyticum]|uniref:phage regulatory CII family protein n=1 Tax=Chromobacterium haemolyticum TaxID=394935 RepID=UPI0002DE25F8|nr:phage regulatory CII family protein [Chromobacterium haemolyticum]